MCRNPEMKGKASRCIFQPLQLLTHSSCSPLCWPLCDERLCPLGATISPSNSFQPGIHTASPIPFSGCAKPPKRQATCKTRGGSLWCARFCPGLPFCSYQGWEDITIKMAGEAGWHRGVCSWWCSWATCSRAHSGPGSRCRYSLPMKGGATQVLMPTL